MNVPSRMELNQVIGGEGSEMLGLGEHSFIRKSEGFLILGFPSGKCYWAFSL